MWKTNLWTDFSRRINPAFMLKRICVNDFISPNSVAFSVYDCVYFQPCEK